MCVAARYPAALEPLKTMRFMGLEGDMLGNPSNFLLTRLTLRCERDDPCIPGPHVATLSGASPQLRRILGSGDIEFTTPSNVVVFGRGESHIHFVKAMISTLQNKVVLARSQKGEGVDVRDTAGDLIWVPFVLIRDGFSVHVVTPPRTTWRRTLLYMLMRELDDQSPTFVKLAHFKQALASDKPGSKNYVAPRRIDMLKSLERPPMHTILFVHYQPVYTTAPPAPAAEAVPKEIPCPVPATMPLVPAFPSPVAPPPPLMTSSPARALPALTLPSNAPTPPMCARALAPYFATATSKRHYAAASFTSPTSSQSTGYDEEEEEVDEKQEQEQQQESDEFVMSKRLRAADGYVSLTPLDCDYGDNSGESEREVDMFCSVIDNYQELLQHRLRETGARADRLEEAVRALL
jgi:hypothetical protein